VPSFWPETCLLFFWWPSEGHKSALRSIVIRESPLSTTSMHEKGIHLLQNQLKS
jgi:hypothetical protein